jgi:hypothetical protein
MIFYNIFLPIFTPIGIIALYGSCCSKPFTARGTGSTTLVKSSDQMKSIPQVEMPVTTADFHFPTQLGPLTVFVDDSFSIEFSSSIIIHFHFPAQYFLELLASIQ